MTRRAPDDYTVASIRVATDVDVYKWLPDPDRSLHLQGFIGCPLCRMDGKPRLFRTETQYAWHYLRHHMHFAHHEAVRRMPFLRTGRPPDGS